MKIDLGEEQIKLLKTLVQKKIEGIDWVMENKKPDDKKKAFLSQRLETMKEMLVVLDSAVAD